MKSAFESSLQAFSRMPYAPIGSSSRQRLQQAINDARGAMRQSDRLALLLIELDKFELVNDLCGPIGSDDVLNVLAQDRLSPLTGARTLHLDAHQFICLLPFAEEHDVTVAFVERLKRVIGEPIWSGHHVVRLTASIGLVIDDEVGASADRLLHAASIALSHARNAGGNTICRFHRGMLADIGKRAALENDFRSGLIRSEILPYFQPIVMLGSGLLKGFEALARWHHPEQGLITPDQFLPMADDMGLDRDLLFMMMRQACRTARDWPPHFTVSINVTPSQLCDPSIALTMLQILFASGLAPGRLIVEITENSLIHSVASARETIRSLRNAGISIALDDFGTGYASLAHLCDLEIDQLKIDRTLIQALDREAGRKLVKAVVDLGSSLSMPVTAEGVETQEQARFMQNVNCAHGQGYLFGHPMLAEHAQKLALEHFPAG